VEIQLIDLFNRQATGITEWKKKNGRGDEAGFVETQFEAAGLGW
jgi:hypothetical protein